jgi:hypothetical protein
VVHLPDHVASRVIPHPDVLARDEGDTGWHREGPEPQAAARPGGEGLRAVLPAVGLYKSVAMGGDLDARERHPGEAMVLRAMIALMTQRLAAQTP